MQLYNRVNKEELKVRLMKEPFKRKTLSFYRYVILDDPQAFRDVIYREWFSMQCFGRIYVAHEGINAQMSVPEHYVDDFLKTLNVHPELKDMPIKWAVEDDGKSFYKLTLKVRPKIVADGLDDGAFDVTNVGNHLEAVEFHKLLDQPDTIVVDMRNHYESEVGHFEGAICPDVDTFREELDLVVEELKDQKDKKLLMYCTGGVRCEKASAWMKHNGFTDVNQLHGGIIEYARKIDELGLESKFRGKNFVFDERLGESINGEIISRCHQCGKPADTHTNCANSDCHLLFIQCKECSDTYEACCSDECKDVIHLPEEIQALKRKELHQKYSSSKIFKSRLRPDLKPLRQEV
ncbi:MAG: rhodanese-related sulfurtransferase [Bacteroidales bacterium]|nr:rhodanese-related sulfurtransferase [Bacteroidales bacterium]